MSGGVGGELEFPPYLKDTHGWLLNSELIADPFVPTEVIVDLFQGLKLAQDANPLLSVTGYNPDELLEVYRDKLDEFSNSLTVMNPVSTWQEMVTATLDTLDDGRSELIDTFNEKSAIGLAQAYNRVNGQFWDINGAAGTVFPTYLAVMERTESLSNDDFAAKTLVERQRESILSVSNIIQLLQIKLASDSSSVQLEEAHARLKLGAKMDENRINTTYLVDDAMWDLNVLQRGFAGMASITGAPVVPKELTRFETISSGIANSAALALTVGTSVGPVAGGITLLAGSLLSVAQANQ